MTWLSPMALWMGGAGVLTTVIAHLLVQRQPRARALATARFLPEGTITAATLQRVPTNWWWLALRSVAVALLALGAAGPVREPTRVPGRSIVLLDGAAPDSVAQRVRRALRDVDVLIALDAGTSGRLSAALVRVARMRDSLARTTEQLTLRLVSPLSRDVFDAATPVVRAQVPESIQVERVAARAVAVATRREAPGIRGGPADDVIRLAYARLDALPTSAETPVIQRGRALTGADSADAQRGAVVLWWPAEPPDPDEGSLVEARGTALAGVRMDRATWIAPLQRMPSALRGAPVGHWDDGSTAIAEMALGAGCLRDVGIGVPQRGDRALGVDATPFLRALVAPCRGVRAETEMIPDADLAWLAPAPRTAVRSAPLEARSTLAPWLIGAGLALGVLEAVLRLRSRA